MPKPTPILHTLQVGLPQVLGHEGARAPMERTWSSGIFKSAVSGPVYLDFTHIEGDGQFDRVHHGGPDKAVCVYALRRLAYWQKRLGQPVQSGGFGENFTVKGQDDGSVCIGDVFIVGEAVVEVSQPRSPCWKLARRWQEKSLSLWVQQTGFTGWYLRVLDPGYIEAGQPLELTDRPNPSWTVLRANRVRYSSAPRSEAIESLLACEALSDSWSDHLHQILTKGELPDEAGRLLGHNDLA